MTLVWAGKLKNIFSAVAHKPVGTEKSISPKELRLSIYFLVAMKCIKVECWQHYFKLQAVVNIHVA